MEMIRIVHVMRRFAPQLGVLFVVAGGLLVVFRNDIDYWFRLPPIMSPLLASVILLYGFGLLSMHYLRGTPEPLRFSPVATQI